MSENGLKILKQSEGTKKFPYLDSANILTIGVGHALNKEEVMRGRVFIKKRNAWVDYRKRGISDRDIEDLLSEDIKWAENAVNTGVDDDIHLEQHQFDGLVHFVFNCGSRSFLESTLLKKINECDFQAVPTQIRRWKYVTLPGGRKKIVQGLVNRREIEIRLWLGEI
jgi:lysozyme